MKLSIVAIALASLAVISHADTSDTLAANATVNVGDFWFCNPSFQSNVCPTSIRTGDTVTWNWVGSFQHTSTACSDGSFTTCGAAQGWDSPVQTTGTFSQTFNTAGTFYYRCNLHPGTMLGTIEVIQDTDGDAWSDAAESIIGTDPLDGCPDNTADNAWPPDINNDGTISFGDIGLLTSVFGQTAPPVPARRDIAPETPDGIINFGDIGRITGAFGLGCT